MSISRKAQRLMFLSKAVPLIKSPHGGLLNPMQPGEPAMTRVPALSKASTMSVMFEA